jgi:hypothetical protein
LWCHRKAQNSAMRPPPVSSAAAFSNSLGTIPSLSQNCRK